VKTARAPTARISDTEAPLNNSRRDQPDILVWELSLDPDEEPVSQLSTISCDAMKVPHLQHLPPVC